MASISREPNGRRTIQFVAPDGSRKSIRLGKVAQRHAEHVRAKVEHLLAAKLTGHAIDAETARWVAEIDETLASRLAAVGLVPKLPKRNVATLDDFLSAYIDDRTDVKPLTKRHLNDAKRRLVAFFGNDKPLEAITPGDTDEFRRHLRRSLGENTVRRMCGRAKQFFRVAVRKRLILENPFADMVGCAVQANRARDYFLSRDDAVKIIDACPDAQWRLLFALSRFGGLRCPSEHLALKLSDCDWDRQRLRVPSPKTERHDGGEARWIPMFPELRPYLDEVFHAAPPGTVHLITKYRSPNANLRTQLQRIIRKAGLEPWPKLWLVAINVSHKLIAEIAEFAGLFDDLYVSDLFG